MTEKDYFKVKDYHINKIKYLKVSLNIEHNDRLIKIITSHYEKLLNIFYNQYLFTYFF